MNPTITLAGNVAGMSGAGPGTAVELAPLREGSPGILLMTCPGCGGLFTFSEVGSQHIPGRYSIRGGKLSTTVVKHSCGLEFSVRDSTVKVVAGGARG